MSKEANVMRILLAAVLATVIVAPCMAANENIGEQKTQGDVLTPGVNEPRTPDTLKSNPDQRIQTEGRASASKPTEEKHELNEEKRELRDNKIDDRK
jgi:hypothetical protein